LSSHRRYWVQAVGAHHVQAQKNCEDSHFQEHQVRRKYGRFAFRQQQLSDLDWALFGLGFALVNGFRRQWQQEGSAFLGKAHFTKVFQADKLIKLGLAPLAQRRKVTVLPSSSDAPSRAIAPMPIGSRKGPGTKTPSAEDTPERAFDVGVMPLTLEMLR
jgi:hypothetical protein